MFTYKSIMTLREYLKYMDKMRVETFTPEAKILLSTQNETFPSELRTTHIQSTSLLETIIENSKYPHLLDAEVESVIPTQGINIDNGNIHEIDNEKTVVEKDGFAYRRVYFSHSNFLSTKLTTVYEIRLKNSNFASQLKENPCIFDKIRVYEFIDFMREDKDADNNIFFIINAEDNAAPIHMLNSIKDIEKRFKDEEERYLYHIIKARSTRDKDNLYFIYY